MCSELKETKRMKRFNISFIFPFLFLSFFSAFFTAARFSNCFILIPFLVLVLDDEFLICCGSVVANGCEATRMEMGKNSSSVSSAGE